ncbi:hypothetical protein JCM11251_006409 [Rhodosporidiobolus azoricus]
MSSFSTALHRLLNHLRDLPSSLHPLHSSLQRAAIRLSRAVSALQDPRADAKGVELLVRLRGRLQELEEAVIEAETADVPLSNDRTSWSMLRSEAAQAQDELERAVREATNQAVQAATGNGSHSRTPSMELPRRVPPPSSSTAATKAELDAFLSRTSSRSAFGPPSADATAAARARQLNEAFTLFLLSHSPSSVLPPGQTISSIFRQTRSLPSASSPSRGEPGSLESRISTQLHQAYFDSFAAIFTLSSSSSPSSATSTSPSEQEKLTAWTRLAADLSSAAVSLIPSRMRASDPSRFRNAREELENLLLAPGAAGTFNARKALETVKATVELLQQLCAPARDADVRLLLSGLFSALTPSASPAEVAASLVPLIRRVLTLTSDMASDVDRFKRDMATELASEGDLRQVVLEEAAERERKVVKEWVGGEEEVRRATREWVQARTGGKPSEARLKKEEIAAALMESLFSDTAIALPSLSSSAPYSRAANSPSAVGATSDTTLPPPPATPNLLPPPLLVPSPFLFTLQNRLQALVILACLVTLAAPSPPGVDSKKVEEEQDRLVQRVWTILQADIPSPASFVAGLAAEQGRDEVTKIAHLADEVLSYRRNLSALSSTTATSIPTMSGEETTRLRSSVDRILRAEDPVYKLFKGRLKQGVKEGVVSALTGAGAGGARRTPMVPTQLQSGRRAPGTVASSSSSLPTRSASPAVILLCPLKGFDRPPFLREKVQETIQNALFGPLRNEDTGEEADGGGGGAWRWMEEVWGEVLGWAEEDGSGRV